MTIVQIVHFLSKGSKSRSGLPIFGKISIKASGLTFLKYNKFSIFFLYIINFDEYKNAVSRPVLFQMVENLKLPR